MKRRVAVRTCSQPCTTTILLAECVVVVVVVVVVIVVVVVVADAVVGCGVAFVVVEA